MSIPDLLYKLMDIPMLKLSKHENQFLEVILFADLCEELKKFFENKYKQECLHIKNISKTETEAVKKEAQNLYKVKSEVLKNIENDFGQLINSLAKELMALDVSKPSVLKICDDLQLLVQQSKDFSNYNEDEFNQDNEVFMAELSLINHFTFVQICKKLNLTNRETDCLYYLIQGKSAKQIGKELALSPRTIEFYLNNAKNKAGCKSNSEIIIQVMSQLLSK